MLGTSEHRGRHPARPIPTSAPGPVVIPLAALGYDLRLAYTVRQFRDPW